MHLLCRIRGTLYQTLDDQFRASEVLNIDPSEILSQKKSRFVPYDVRTIFMLLVAIKFADNLLQRKLLNSVVNCKYVKIYFCT